MRHSTKTFALKRKIVLNLGKIEMETNLQIQNKKLELIQWLSTIED
jgi:hypothetical protein